MAEPTLNLKKSDLEAKVGKYLGYGLGSANGDTAWDTMQTSDIADCINSGYRRFINTPPVPGLHPGGYEWTFLRPVWTGNLESGATTVLLPEEFGGFEGALTISRSTGTYFPVRLRSENEIRNEHALFPDASGEPAMAAVQWLKGTTSDVSQRAQLYVFPEADAAYTLKAAFYLHPDALSDTYPYAVGGAAHAETLLESCLAVGEERRDDMANGPHFQAFMRCLAASIRQDQRLKPQWFGKNRDRSDDLQTVLNWHWNDGNYTATIAGADPG